MRRFLRLETLAVLIPLIIAGVQVLRVETSDLTRWRGGGFGMYSDPHPNQSRNVWLSGTRDGAPLAVRLFPADERWILDRSRDNEFADLVKALEDAGREFRDYPSQVDLARITHLMGVFQEDHADAPLVRNLVPNSEVMLRVVEVKLDAEWKNLGASVLWETAL